MYVMLKITYSSLFCTYLHRLLIQKPFTNYCVVKNGLGLLLVLLLSFSYVVVIGVMS